MPTVERRCACCDAPLRRPLRCPRCDAVLCSGGCLDRHVGAYSCRARQPRPSTETRVIIIILVLAAAATVAFFGPALARLLP